MSTTPAADRADPMARVAENLTDLLHAEVESRAIDLTLQKQELRPVVAELVKEYMPQMVRDVMPQIIEAVARELARSLNISAARVQDAALKRERERKEG